MTNSYLLARIFLLALLMTGLTLLWSPANAEPSEKMKRSDTGQPRTSNQSPPPLNKLNPAQQQALVEAQKLIDKALANKDYGSADAYCRTKIDLLRPSDSEEYANALTQHASILRHLFQFPDAAREEAIAAEVRKRVSQTHLSAATIESARQLAQRQATVREPIPSMPGGPVVIHPSPPKPGVAFSNSKVDFGPYVADLQRRIKKHWFPPKGNESKRVTVIFRVHKEGDVSDLTIKQSCGVALADNAALKAVEDAMPLRMLPLGAPESVWVQFTFDYNVFNAGGHATLSDFRP